MKDIIKIIRYSKSLKFYYYAIASFVVLVAILNQATPFLLKFLVDDIVKHIKGVPVATSLIIWLLVLILISNIATTLISDIQEYLGDMLSAKLNSLLSLNYYRHILRLPLEYYDNEITGRVTSRLERSIVTVSELIKSFANNFVGMFLTTILTLGILAYYSLPVALLLAVLFPLYIWITTLSSRSWQRRQEGINKDIDYANGRFIESIGQIRVVKAFTQEVAEWGIFKNKRDAIEHQTSGQSKEWHIYDTIRGLALNIVFAAIYAFIIWQTFKGRYSLGTMTLMIQLTSQARWPLYGSSYIVESIQRAIAGSKDFFSVMEIEPKIQDAPDAQSLKVTRGGVEYHQVDFAYNEGQPVLQDISFKIAPGSKLALVGESGQGKTTIANLLMRFYDTSAGTITIDGTNIKNVTQESLRAQIGVVFQEPALFSGTVAENITYGQAKVNQEAMTEAARAANALDFIKKLPQGFDTEIGERGVKLSGGQKQRIAIARAILKDAPILILDEATSSLDSRAEREVQEALDHLMQQRTTLIIAHRLSTIASVDTIVTLKDGRVDEIGPPAELAQTEGIYAQLLELQAPTRANKAKLRKYDIAKA